MGHEFYIIIDRRNGAAAYDRLSTTRMPMKAMEPGAYGKIVLVP